MTPKRQRLWFVAFAALSVSLGALLALSALRDNIVFFFTPSELAGKAPAPGTHIRIGGLVREGSVTRINKENVRFTITDGTAEMEISYRGALPSLFREGQGVVAEGPYSSADRLNATRILAKHDETYMPREVAEKLKTSGHWHGAAP